MQADLEGVSNTRAKIRIALMAALVIALCASALSNLSAVRDVEREVDIARLRETVPVDVESRLAWYVLMLSDARSSLWAKIRFQLLLAAGMVTLIVFDAKRSFRRPQQPR